jgi:hypothetical protein
MPESLDTALSEYQELSLEIALQIFYFEYYTYATQVLIKRSSAISSLIRALGSFVDGYMIVP